MYNGRSYKFDLWFPLTQINFLAYSQQTYAKSKYQLVLFFLQLLPSVHLFIYIDVIAFNLKPNNQQFLRVSAHPPGDSVALKSNIMGWF